MKKRSLILMAVSSVLFVLVLCLLISTSYDSEQENSSSKQNGHLKTEEIKTEIDSEDFESVLGDGGDDMDEETVTETGEQVTASQTGEDNNKNKVTYETNDTSTDDDEKDVEESDFDVIEDKTTKYGPIY